MTVFRNGGQWDTSNVWFEDGRIRLYDKCDRLPQMQHIDWGLGIMRAEALADGRVDEAFDLGGFLLRSFARRQPCRIRGHDAVLRDRFGRRTKETDALLRAQPP